MTEEPILPPDDQWLADSEEAARRIIDDGQNWHPVESADLDAANPLSDRERRLVREGAKAAIMQQDSAEYIEELENAHRFDAMTGLRTVEFFRDELPRAIGVTHRARKAFGLFKVDGHSLNLINNEISGTAGDEYIITIAQALKASVRTATDGVYRGGGKSDEFWVTMMMINESDELLEMFLLEKRAQFDRELRQRLRESPVLASHIDDFDLGVYVGYSSIDFKVDAGHKENSHHYKNIARHMIEEADEMMRQDKVVTKQKRLNTSEDLR